MGLNLCYWSHLIDTDASFQSEWSVSGVSPSPSPLIDTFPLDYFPTWLMYTLVYLSLGFVFQVGEAFAYLPVFPERRN